LRTESAQFPTTTTSPALVPANARTVTTVSFADTTNAPTPASVTELAVDPPPSRRSPMMVTVSPAWPARGVTLVMLPSAM
jgi:hypothetical protein